MRSDSSNSRAHSIPRTNRFQVPITIRWQTKREILKITSASQKLLVHISCVHIFRVHTVHIFSRTHFRVHTVHIFAYTRYTFLAYTFLAYTFLAYAFLSYTFSHTRMHTHTHTFSHTQTLTRTHFIDYKH